MIRPGVRLSAKVMTPAVSSLKADGPVRLACTISSLRAAKSYMAPLVILTIALGFYPKPVFDTTAGAVKAMIAPYEKLMVAQSAEGETRLAKLEK